MFQGNEYYSYASIRLNNAICSLTRKPPYLEVMSFGVPMHTGSSTTGSDTNQIVTHVTKKHNTKL